VEEHKVLTVAILLQDQLLQQVVEHQLLQVDLEEEQTVADQQVQEIAHQ
jgi:hypothetical protein